MEYGLLSIDLCVSLLIIIIVNLTFGFTQASPFSKLNLSVNFFHIRTNHPQLSTCISRLTTCGDSGERRCTTFRLNCFAGSRTCVIQGDVGFKPHMISTTAQCFVTPCALRTCRKREVLFVTMVTEPTVIRCICVQERNAVLKRLPRNAPPGTNRSSEEPSKSHGFDYETAAMTIIATASLVSIFSGVYLSYLAFKNHGKREKFRSGKMQTGRFDQQQPASEDKEIRKHPTVKFVRLEK